MDYCCCWVCSGNGGCAKTMKFDVVKVDMVAQHDIQPGGDRSRISQHLNVADFDVVGRADIDRDRGASRAGRDRLEIGAVADDLHRGSQTDSLLEHARTDDRDPLVSAAIRRADKRLGDRLARRSWSCSARRRYSSPSRRRRRWKPSPGTAAKVKKAVVTAEPIEVRKRNPLMSAPSVWCCVVRRRAAMAAQCGRASTFSG